MIPIRLTIRNTAGSTGPKRFDQLSDHLFRHLIGAAFAAHSFGPLPLLEISVCIHQPFFHGNSVDRQLEPFRQFMRPRTPIFVDTNLRRHVPPIEDLVFCHAQMAIV